jgi:hypothetical protein
MKKIVFIAILIAMCSACQKEQVKAPEFDVTTTKSTYKAGEYVVFEMTGNPDYITLYTGETGSRYIYNKRYTAAGTPKLQFTSQRANGTQTGSLQLMVSADFKGVGADTATTTANIAGATWTDITSRATWSTGTAVASGAIDLSDFPLDKPLFFAFKYNGASGSIQNKWTISALTFTNTLPDQSVYTIANLSSAAIANYGVGSVISPGWVGYKVANNYNWVISSGASLIITGATPATAATAVSEAWTFTGGITLNRIANDIGTPIKETSGRLAPSEYPFLYKETGTKTVTFVATNSSIYGQEETVKQLTLNITN